MAVHSGKAVAGCRVNHEQICGGVAGGGVLAGLHPVVLEPRGIDAWRWPDGGSSKEVSPSSACRLSWAWGSAGGDVDVGRRAVVWRSAPRHRPGVVIEAVGRFCLVVWLGLWPASAPAACEASGGLAGWKAGPQRARNEP